MVYKNHIQGHCDYKQITYQVRFTVITANSERQIMHDPHIKRK